MNTSYIFCLRNTKYYSDVHVLLVSLLVDQLSRLILIFFLVDQFVFWLTIGFPQFRIPNPIFEKYIGRGHSKAVLPGCNQFVQNSKKKNLDFQFGIRKNIYLVNSYFSSFCLKYTGCEFFNLSYFIDPT